MRSRLFLKLDGTRARFFLLVSPSLMPGGVASDAGDLGLRPGPCGLCIFFFWSAPRRVLLVFDMLRGVGVPVSLGCTPSKPPPLRPENLMPHAPADVGPCVQPWGRDGVERRPPPARGPRPPRPAPRVWLVSGWLLLCSSCKFPSRLLFPVWGCAVKSVFSFLFFFFYFFFSF